MPFRAPLMLTMICQMPPPRKLWGLVVRSVQISESLSFQVSRAEFRFWTTQLLLLIESPPQMDTGRAFPLSLCYFISR